MGNKGLSLFYALAIIGALSLVAGMLGAQLHFAGRESIWKALQDPSIQKAIALSLTTATIASSLALLLAVPTAYALSRSKFPGMAIIDVLLDLPVVLSPIAVGVSLLLLLRTAPGRWFESNLITFVFETPGIVLAQFTISLALSIRILKATFQEVDVRYEQVSRFLGCTPFQTLYRVTLPIAKPGLLAAFILSWARSIGEFGATVTLAGAIAGETETIPVAIYMRMSSVDIEGAVALIAILSIVSLAVLVAIRLITRAK